MATRQPQSAKKILANPLRIATLIAMEPRSTSVRVDDETRDRLKELSDKSGISITKLITLATQGLIERAEKDGAIHVPVNTVSELVGKKPRSGKRN